MPCRVWSHQKLGLHSLPNSSQAPPLVPADLDFDWSVDADLSQDADLSESEEGDDQPMRDSGHCRPAELPDEGWVG